MRFYNDQHREIQRTARRIVNEHINPNIDSWEEEEIFPARKLFKILGDAKNLWPTSGERRLRTREEHARRRRSVFATIRLLTLELGSV